MRVCDIAWRRRRPCARSKKRLALFVVKKLKKLSAAKAAKM
jgi:hypothetical protein